MKTQLEVDINKEDNKPKEYHCTRCGKQIDEDTDESNVGYCDRCLEWMQEANETNEKSIKEDIEDIVEQTERIKEIKEELVEELKGG